MSVNKLLLVLFAFFIAVPASAGTPSVANAESLGGVETTSTLTIPEGNTAGYFTISCAAVSSTTDHFYPCNKNGVAYQVTAGKTFKSIKNCGWGNAANSDYQIVTATASIAQSASSLTSGVFENGATAFYSHSMAVQPSTNCWTTTFDAAASTFVGIQSNAGTGPQGWLILGKEI